MKYDENVESRYGIKLVDDRTVRKEAEFSTRASFDWIRKLVLHLIANPDPMVVPIYRFEVIEETPETDSRHWGVYKYAYEMMRLPMLMKEEKMLITAMIQKRWSSNNPPDPIIQSGEREFPELFAFMTRVLNEGNYTDLHDNNFLKDEQGNYRIIDLEGFNKYPGLGNRQ